MSPWEWLGIDQDASEIEVRRAYAQMLRRHRPDEDPKGFQTTHEAYRITLQWARQRQRWADAAADSGEDSDDQGIQGTPPDLHRDRSNTPPLTESPEAQPEIAADPGQPPVEAVTPMPDAAASAVPHGPIPTPAADPIAQQTPSHEAADALVDDDPPEEPVFDPDLLSRTQPFPLLDFDAPILRRILTEPGTPVDPAELQIELSAALAGRAPGEREELALRIAGVLEASSSAPTPGVVSVLAEQLDWDARFLRHRSSRIVELLATDEVCAAIRRRLQDPAPANRPLRALAQPPRLWRPRSWSLWWSARSAHRELLQLQTEGGPAALDLLDPEAIRLTCELSDSGYIGLRRVARWLAVGVGVAVGWFLLMLLAHGREVWTDRAIQGTALGLGAWTVAAAYVRARVRQVYALPLEPARPLWLMALLLGLLVLAGSAPEAWFAPILWLVGIATATLIGSARLWPGLLAVGASLMLPAAVQPLLSTLPDVWLIANLVLLSACVLAIDHLLAHRSGRPLAEVATEQQPLYWLGGAIFMLLAVVGAISEEARQPLPVRPTHVA